MVDLWEFWCAGQSNNTRGSKACWCSNVGWPKAYLWVLFDQLMTLWKSLTNFLLISYEFLINFLPISYQLLINFLPISYQFLTNFVQISYQFLTNFLEIPYQFCTNFLPISYQFLTNFLEIPNQFLTNTQRQAREMISGLSLVLKTNLLSFNLLNAKLYPICNFLALLGAHHILHVSRIRDNRTQSRVTSGF